MILEPIYVLTLKYYLHITMWLKISFLIQIFYSPTSQFTQIKFHNMYNVSYYQFVLKGRSKGKNLLQSGLALTSDLMGGEHFSFSVSVQSRNSWMSYHTG